MRNVYQYGVGHKTFGSDRQYLAAQTQAFAADGYRFPNLVTHVASSPEFFKVIVPKEDMVKGALLGVGASLVNSFGQRAARRIAQELLAPRERRDGSPPGGDRRDGASGESGRGG